MRKLFLILIYILILGCSESKVDVTSIFKKPDPFYQLMDDSATMLDPLQVSSMVLGTTVQRLVIHCTAQDIRWPWTPDRLVEFFLKPKSEGGRGWSKPGYTFFINREGNLFKLNDAWNWDEVIDYQEITFGARGYNSSSLHIVWDGGAYKGEYLDNRTKEQKQTLRTFVTIFVDAFPKADVVGHRDLPFVDKSCPLFDVKKEYKDLI